MKIYIVRNPNQPQDGQQSVLLSVDSAGKTVEATLLYQNYLSDGEDGESVTLGGKDWRVLDRKTIAFDELKNTREFSDRTSFMIGIEWSKNKWSTGLIPLYAVSMESKLSALSLVRSGLIPPTVVGFHIPYADSSFEECAVTVNIPSSSGACFVDGLDSSNVIQSPYSTSGQVQEMLIFPHISVTGPTTSVAGQDIEFAVRVVDANGAPLTRDVTLYLEAVNGTLPKNRVRTSAGQATVKMQTGGLAAGDKVRLKAGFKFFSGADDAEVLLA